MMRDQIEFIKYNGRFVAFGFILILFSAFGQTFFLSLFNGDIQHLTGLSNGGMGLVYSVATAMSACLIPTLGGQIDTVPFKRFTLFVCLGLVAACASLAMAYNGLMLLISYVLLRFFGQGMMSHVSMVGMGRYFESKRGQAVSLASLGYPIGEALFPIVGLLMLNHFGFEVTWLTSACFVALIMTPLVFWLLKGHDQRHANYVQQQQTKAQTDVGDTVSKATVLKDWRFYCIAFGVLATGFINTGVFFHHTALLHERGWSQTMYAHAFINYALGNVIGSLLCGYLVDRVKARRLMAGYLLPMMLGLFCLSDMHSGWAIELFMLGSGMSQGASAILTTAVWAELYGQTLLGTIRSWIVALKVLFTAISPVLFGVLIDHHYSSFVMLDVNIAYCGLAMGLLAVAQCAQPAKAARHTLEA